MFQESNHSSKYTEFAILLKLCERMLEKDHDTIIYLKGKLCTLY